MSKSKGNFYTARDLFAKGIEPGALRLELIKTHYRSNANFTMQGLTDSQRMIDRWRRIGDLTIAHGDPSPATREALDAFASAMSDDLNIAGAVAAMNTWSSKLERPSSGDVAAMRTFENVLGVLSLERAKSTTSDIGIFLGGLAPDPAVITKLEARRAARAAKDFKQSDLIRDELLAMGFAIKDVAGGKVEVSRK